MPSPIKVGILNDMSAGPSGRARPDSSETEQWLLLVVNELVSNGRIAGRVDFVHSWGLGLPSGTAAAVEQAYAELVAQDVLLVVGPAIGDNALVATPLAERHRVPTLHWAGAERARGEYMFQLQVGSHEDESIVLARYLASLRNSRVGVVYDLSPIGEQHLLFLQAEADLLGIEIIAAVSIAPLAEDASAQVGIIVAARVDAIVYLGLGLAAAPVARALADCGWRGAKAMNTAGIRGYDPKFARTIDGWVYIDMYSDANTTLAALRRRLGPAMTRSLRCATRYDLARLVAEGLARAPEATREGVKEGLERVKWLPAAEGHEGTLLGFGRYDRGALHGRYLVLRQWLNGESVEVAVSGY
jgi:ABC-type branched-subunit amino acid transport system substrate-binding protein